MINDRLTKMTPAMIRAAANANADGVGIKTLSEVFGLPQSAIRAELRAAGYPGAYSGPGMHPKTLSRIVALHEPRLRASMTDTGVVVTIEPRYTPLVPEFGIKIHVSSNGVSLPYTPCIHGDRHV